MQEIDVLLDDNPALSMEMVLTDQRNRQAHQELTSFNETGKFVNKHPLVIRQNRYRDLYEELLELKRTNPSAFLTEITNVIQNIRRIQSQLKNKKYKSEEEKLSWEQNLEKALIRKQALENLL